MKKLILLFASLVTCHLSLLAQNQVPGTVVTAPIVPNDLRDQYPTHVDKYGKAGYRVVKTKGERDSIKVSLREFGMLVHVNAPAVDSTYILTRNPGFPSDLSKGLWLYHIPRTNQATYNMTKGAPPKNYVTLYPYKQVRTPIYFREPFLTNLYFMRINCYNDRGMVPYLIVEQKPAYFSIDVAEPCTCTWEARALN